MAAVNAIYRSLPSAAGDLTAGTARKSPGSPEKYSVRIIPNKSGMLGRDRNSGRKKIKAFVFFLCLFCFFENWKNVPFFHSVKIPKMY